MARSPRVAGAFVTLLALAACSRPVSETPRPGWIYVSDETGGHVDVVDPAAGTLVERISVGKRPRGIVLSRDGSQLYVALSGSPIGVTRAIDDVGMRPWGIALAADGRTLYSANGPSGDVSVVDVASGKTSSRVAVGGSPWGVAIAR